MRCHLAARPLQACATKLSATLFALCLCAGVFAQSTRPLTLKQAIDLALKSNPDLISADASKLSAKEGLRQAESQFFPDLRTQYSQDWGSSSRTSPSSLNGRSGSVVLSYKLLDSGQREAQRLQARAGYRAALDQEVDRRSIVIANVATAFYEVQRQQALVTVSKANLKRAETTLELVQAQVEAGVSAKKDVYQAQADLEAAKVALLQAENNGELSQSQLKEAIGIETDDHLQLAATAGQAAEALGSESLRSLKRIAIQDRPDVAALVQDVDRSRAGVRAAQANAGPILNFDTSVSGFFAPRGSDVRSASLTLSFPIFDGGFVSSVVREAKQGQRGAEASLASKKIAVATEVEQAYRSLLTAQAALPAAESALKAAQVNYEAAFASRKEGVSSLIEVVTAQTLLVQAETNRVRAEFDLYSASVVLAEAVGRIDLVVQFAEKNGEQP